MTRFTLRQPMVRPPYNAIALMRFGCRGAGRVIAAAARAAVIAGAARPDASDRSGGVPTLLP